MGDVSGAWGGWSRRSPGALGRGDFGWRVVGFGGAGCLLGLLLAWIGAFVEGPPWTAGDLALWVCDREMDAVYGLDGEGFVVLERRASRPVEVAAGESGGLWLLEDQGPESGGRRALVCLRTGADDLRVAEFDLAGGLRAAPRAGVRLLHGTDSARHWSQFGSDGQLERQLAAPGAIGWEPLPDGVALVFRDGLRAHSWSPLDPPRPRRLELRLESGCEVLAHGARAKGIWLLLKERGELLLRGLNSELEVEFESSLPAWPAASEEAWFLACSGSDSIWIVGRSGHVLRLNLGSGRPRWNRLLGPIQGIRSRAGELWCVSPVGLLRFDSGVRGLPGQGGFGFLAGIALVSSRN